MEIEDKTKIVGYIRVSTKKQGDSGLGLEAQKQAIEEYANRNGLEITEIFIEIESGRKSSRAQLQAAIARAKEIEATLVIAKLDRLSRNVSFLFSLREAKVNFLALDCSELNTITLAVFAGMAQFEAEEISQRIKDCLQQAKKQGKVLGSPIGFSNAARNAAIVARKEKARNANMHAKSAIEMFIKDGYGLHSIARRLETLGIKTSRGKIHTSTSVLRIIKSSGILIEVDKDEKIHSIL